MRQTTWREIRQYVDQCALVVDADGNSWLRDGATGTLVAVTHNPGARWAPADDDIVLLSEPEIPEPPDGTRLEFEHWTDLYAMIRDDASAIEAGWPAGDGGDVWLLYGETVPCSWAAMWARFGAVLLDAVRLVPVEEDLPKRRRWPTEQHRRAKISG